MKIKGLHFEKKELSDLYDKTKCASVIARMYGVKPHTIMYHLRKHGITVKREGFVSPKHIRHYRDDHANWKGGTYFSDGYIYEYAPDHPKNTKGYIRQHRLVMERELGRLLTSDEIVHHINGIKTDNRPENLVLMKRGDHIRSHKVNSPRGKDGRFIS